MLRQRTDRFFLHPRYTTQIEIGQMRVIVVTALALLVLQTGFILSVTDKPPSFQRAFAGETLDIIQLVIMYGGALFAIAAVRLGWGQVGALGILLSWAGGGLLVSVEEAFLARYSLMSLFAFIVLGFALLRERGLFLTLIVGFAAFFVGLARREERLLTFVQPAESVEILNIVLIMIGCAIALWIFLRNTRIAEVEIANEAQDARLRLATITTDIAQRISSKTALDEVLNATVEEIRTRYREIYHAQIFLIDEFGSMARLVASTGEVGQLLLSRGHGLEVGSVSVIGRVTQSGTVVVARAGSSETVHKRNELLPDTVVEAAFPLILENRVIGALDLQSRDITAFANDDLPIFQSLADNTAVAIENARLYEQTQSRLRENQRLLDQMRGAMREIERLNRQLTGRSWADYLESYDSNPNIEIDLDADRLVRGATLTPTLQQAITSDSSIQESRPEGAVIAIPIRVRGQVIGAMEFELTEEEPTIESVDLAQTVGERFGLALENTRLYEATQRVAQREQRVNAIAAQYQNVTTVDELLRITVAEIGDLLGAERASIRLGTANGPERMASGPVQPIRSAPSGGGAGANGSNGHHEGGAR